MQQVNGFVVNGDLVVADELLVGVVRDPAHGFVLTLGAGGTLTELWDDSVSLLLPVREEEAEPDAVAENAVTVARTAPCYGN